MDKTIDSPEDKEATGPEGQKARRPEGQNDMSLDAVPLTDSEQEKLRRYEAVLTLGPSFDEKGRALRGIRDERLYRATYKTLEAYCYEKFGMARSTVYQLIDSVQVVDELVNSLSAMADKPKR